MHHPALLLLVSLASLKLAKTVITPNVESKENLLSDYTPQQVHLSWTGHDGEMTVTWSTMKLPPDDDEAQHFSVRFGTTASQLNESAPATVTKFVDGGPKQRTQFIYRATMQRMHTNTTYFYSVGSASLRSRQFRFQTMPPKANWSPLRLLIFGDFGTTNDRSLSAMRRQVDAGLHDLVLHNGDFAYDMHTDDGRVGDAFMREIEPIAAQIPYMTTVGNHEYAYNFSNYRNRFSMPGGTESFYYSLDMGAVHLVLFTSDWYFHPNEYVEQLREQYKWIDEDLRLARERNDQWIVAAAHKPLYCSNRDFDNCNPVFTVMRDGLPQLGIPGFEQLFYRRGVDLYFGAHEHCYERNWPTYQSQVRKGSRRRPYFDSLATVYITSGAAGNREGQVNFMQHPYAYSAFRSMDYGFTRLHAYNTTYMFIDQVGLDSRNASRVIDSFSLSKTQVTPAWLRK